MALELTRDGQNLTEHLGRFINEGKYAPLYASGIITRHAVVDLRSPGQGDGSVLPRLKDANLYTIVFNSAFDGAKVYCNGVLVGGDMLHVRGTAGEATIQWLKATLLTAAGS